MKNPLIEPLEARIAPATFSIVSPAGMSEGDSGTMELLFKVTLTDAITSNATVHFVTGNVTTGTAATPVEDYDSTNGTLTFVPGGLAEQFIHVPIKGDTKHEDNESFLVTLDSPTGATIDTNQKNATGTILNDDPVPTVSVGNATIVEGDNGIKTAVFDVTLSNRSSSIVKVKVSTVDDTATAASGDYVAITDQVVNFLPAVGTLVRQISVTINGDTTVEPDEMFKVLLSGEVNATIGDGEGIGTITNDESVFIDSSTVDVRLPEGGARATTMMNFTVKLGKTYTEAVTVTAATTPGSATPGVDFTSKSQLLTFAAGETSKTFSVEVLGDADDEADENFFVDLSAPSANVGLGVSHAVGTIVNDEVTASVNDASITEANGDISLTFNVTLSKAANHPVTINFTTQDGTAMAGANKDFEAKTDSVTFAAGETMQPVTIIIHGDTIGEATENFLLKLTGSSGAQIVRNTGTGTILNDDTALVVSNARVVEGGTNEKTRTAFTVTLLNPPVTGDVTVRVGTVDETGTGKAAAGTDYTRLLASENLLTFFQGETTKEVFVEVKGDFTQEPDETFLVRLSDASANAAIVGDGTGTIANDDLAFTINDVTVTEGDAGTLNAVFLVRLLVPPGGSPPNSTVTVDVATEAGTASSSDFSAVTTTLSFARGVTQQLVTVPIVGDLIREGTETFLVKLANPTGGVTIAKTSGIGTILDNNDPAPTVSIGNGILAEGNAGSSVMEFTVTLSQPSQDTVTASYATHDLASAAHAAVVGVDYSQVANGVVTFAPGQTRATISVPILGDTVDEFDETFGVSLSSPGGAALGNAEAIGTIQNDEVTVRISNSPTVLEGNNGTTIYLFPVELTVAGGGALQNEVTVNFETKDDTAISTGANKDFTALTGPVTFAPGGNLLQQISITVTGDARHEANEQFFVKLLSSANASIVTAQGIGTINNDDSVQVSIGDATITEGNLDAQGKSTTSDLNFVVTLDQPSDVAVSVKVNTVDGTAHKTVVVAGPPIVTTLNDFTGITDQTITFAPGQTTQNVTVKIVGDATEEALKNETFTVVLSAPSVAGATILDGTGTGTITDNDNLQTLSVSNTSVVEGNAGTTDAEFTVTLSGTVNHDVTFTYATADATAIAGQDYEAVTQGTGKILAGQTSVKVKVKVTGDTASEINERFLLNLLDSPEANISATAKQATALIVDDEAGGARVKLVPVNGVAFNEEDQVVEFRVERDPAGDVSKAVTVQYETVDDLAQSFGNVPDFVAKAGTISFAAGSTTASETIRVRIIGDRNFENAETFQVRLFNPVNAAILDGSSVVAESLTDVTINEDLSDLAPTLSIADVRIVEGNSGSQEMKFIVKLSAANEKNVVKVSVGTLDGSDPATSANGMAGQVRAQDYLPNAGTLPLTFLEGETEKTFSVTINSDVRDESDEETFRVRLSGAVGAVVTRADATGTIVDDDAAPTLSLSGPVPSPVEGDAGVTTATYKVTLSEISERPVSVQVTTNGVTAVSSGLHPDFQARDHFDATYVLGTSDKSFDFTVLINGDTTNEGDETFGVAISDAVNAKIGGGTTSVTTTITDNDPLPVFLVSDASVVEGNSGTTEMVFTVSLSAASEKIVEVKYETQDVLTLTGATSTGPLADFVAKSGALKFAVGETEKEVRVVINGDTFKEKGETFSLLLKQDSAVNGTILPSAATGTGTILTDGDATIGIAIRDAFAVEGPSGPTRMSFTVELSDSLTTDTTFGVVLTSGTAVRGSDFAALQAGDISPIAKNTKTGTIQVTVNGDGDFEATESFFVGLRNVVNAGGEDITIVGGTGRGTIFNDDLRRVDNQTIQFIDVDGDLATVHISKGFLGGNRLSFSDPNPVGGRKLQQINLLGNNTQFQNANLAVTAVAQPGFNGSEAGVKGDGLVNVGWIIASLVNGEILQFVNGIDLNNVTIDGDLGKIWVGDTVATSAIKNLTVRSMGKLGTTTQGDDSANLDTVSLVLGPIDNLHVLGNFQTTLRVVGSQFGIIRNLQIDGALLGGPEDRSGEIAFTGRIGNAQIGRIVGGAGDMSGSLVGSLTTGARIGNLHVIGDVRGGAGAESGVVSAHALGTVRVGSLLGGAGASSGRVHSDTVDSIVVTRNITGGDGLDSGQIFADNALSSARVFGEIRGGNGQSSGLLGATVRIANAYVFGSIFGGEGVGSGGVRVDGAISQIQTGALVGGDGENSGAIRTGGNLFSLTINGDVLGGSGNGSGGVDVNGKLTSALIRGDVEGGNSTASTALVKSGFITAHRLQSLTITGDLKAGADGGAGIASSGTIRSETTIGSIRIRGDVTGSENVAAIISAPGDTSGAAMQTLIIGGNAKFAEILGGYGANATAALPRGNAANADARIGTVSIGGDLQSTSIIAGVAAGPDGLFGTTDDFPLGGTSVTNAARSVSTIARIIIGGRVLGGSMSSGIEAQYVQSIAVRGSVFALQAGPGSTQDGAPGRELVAGSKILVFEVPVV